MILLSPIGYEIFSDCNFSWLSYNAVWIDVVPVLPVPMCKINFMLDDSMEFVGFINSSITCNNYFSSSVGLNSTRF